MQASEVILRLVIDIGEKIQFLQSVLNDDVGISRNLPCTAPDAKAGLSITREASATSVFSLANLFPVQYT